MDMKHCNVRNASLVLDDAKQVGIPDKGGAFKLGATDATLLKFCEGARWT